ncbi:hypothetical protein O3G_MSEX009476 [Manduca sexta]|uniref:Uncharacterized protein n=2 Tax=Manduca sexta TaxID=7130 RepID=A0A921ZEA3_MANSE|nr:hypothetical protein O3G_MSEX009476 [Manduca sexta]
MARQYDRTVSDAYSHYARAARPQSYKAGAHTSLAILKATMKRNAASATVVLALLVVGLAITDAQTRDYSLNQDLLRLLVEKNWRGIPLQARWEAPRVAAEMADLEGPPPYREDQRNYIDDEIRAGLEKRSAVATALNSGRRRRQPTPALGVLNDVGSFFDSLRENLETMASLSPEERSNFFHEPPTVVQAPASGGGGGGMHKIYSLRPVKPFGSIRSYNRRSYVEADHGYPGANNHDPGLLWTGLGR